MTTSKFKMSNKVLSVLLCIALLLTYLPLSSLTVSAATTTGSCGTSADYTLTDDGVLTITGSGAIEKNAFSKLAGYSNNNSSFTAYLSIKQVIIGEGITEVGEQAFLQCENITSVTLPSTVTKIKAKAFKDCTSLQTVNFPGGLTNIETQAFNGCEKLESISLPSTLSSIGNEAFQYCYALKEVYLAEGIKTIGRGMFSQCKVLTSITIPASVTTVKQWVFNSCTALTSITIKGKDTSFTSTASFQSCTQAITFTVPCDYDESKVTQATPPTGSTFSKTLHTDADGDGKCDNADCKGAPAVTSVSLNKSTITLDALDATEMLTATVAPDGANNGVTWGSSNTLVATVDGTGKVTARGKGTATITATTVEGSKTATCKVTVSLPENPVESVSLSQTSLTLGVGHQYELDATITPENADIKTVTWASDNTAVATVNTDGIVTGVAVGTATITVTTTDGEKTDTCTVTVIQHTHSWNTYTGTCGGCSMTHDTHGAYTWTDGKCSVCGVIGGTCGKVYEEETVEYILTSDNEGSTYTITISGSGYMGEYLGDTFNDNPPWNDYRSKITTAVVKNGVKDIGWGSFQDHTALTSVTIPDNIEEIKSSAFAGTTALKSIELPDNLKKLGSAAFSGSGITAIEIPNGADILFSAFKDCKGLSSVTLPNDLTDIDGYVFEGCESLTSITLPWTITEIGTEAFYCSGLTSITIPTAVTKIGERAFTATKLTSVEIPASVKTLGDAAFSACRSLKTVTITGTDLSVDEYVFAYADSLESLTIRNTGTVTLGDWAFGIETGTTDKLNSITLPAGVTYATSYAETFKNRNTPVTGVSLDKTVLELYTGGSETLEATVHPENAGNKNVTWTSDDESIATVDKNGLVTGIAGGTATITVTTEYGNYTATCSVKVFSHTHNWTYTASGDTITATCNNTDNNCTSSDGGSVTLKVEDACYTGSPVAATVEGSFTNGATYTVTYNGSETAPSTVDTHTAKLTVSENGTAKQSVTADYTISYLPAPAPAYIINGGYQNGNTYWFKNGETITVSAPADYKISTALNGAYGDSVTFSESDSKVIYLKNADGEMTDAIPISEPLSFDKTAPTGRIQIKDRGFWETLLNKITFGLFFKGDAVATVTAEDADGSGIQSVEYYVASEDLINDSTLVDAAAIAELETAVGDKWSTYDEEIPLEKNAQSVIYVKITDNVGSVTYISSEGIVLYTDAEADTDSVSTPYKAGENKDIAVKLNGNTVKSVANGTTTLTAGTDYTVDGSTITLKAEYLDALNAGEYTFTVSYNPLGMEYEEATVNDVPATTTFRVVIEMVDQNAPAVQSSDETVSGKADGSITGVNDTMEYRKEGDDIYTAISGDTVTNLAAGNYYVRVKGDGNHNPSPDTAVTIAAGRKLTVTVPTAEEQIVYTLTVDKHEFDWQGQVVITFALADGYSKSTTDFAVKVNDTAITLDENDQYTVTGSQTDLTITVAGVVDATPPEAEIAIAANAWTAFLNDITFGLFFKETQGVTITATDMGSGVDAIYYYISEDVLTEDEVKALSADKWTLYDADNKPSVDPDKQCVVYAKATDKAQNVQFISSTGLVFDGTAPVLVGIENGGVYYGDKIFKAIDDHFLKIEVDGTDITDTTQGDDEYKIVADNAEHTVTVTDKAGNVTEWTITVYKQYTVTFVVDGETLTTQTVNYKADADMPEIPTKTGYDRTAPVWDKDGKNITADTEINAVYTINKYTVTFMDENGVYKTVTVKHGETIEMPDPPTKDGYTVTWERDVDTVTADVTVKAVYAKIPVADPTSPQTGHDDQTGDDTQQNNDAQTGESPQTGETGNLWLCFALLFVSGGGLFGTVIYKKKQEAEET